MCVHRIRLLTVVLRDSVMQCNTIDYIFYLTGV